MTKKVVFVLIVCTVLCPSALAVPSLHFSTIHGTGASWTLSATGDKNGTLSFNQTGIEVDDPVGDPVYQDLVKLPLMTFTYLGDTGVSLYGTLTPTFSDQLIITNEDEDDVMSANVALGGMAVIGTTFTAYFNEADDLDIDDYVDDYSDLIDDLAGWPYGIDLSFTGSSTTNLYNLLKSGGGSAIGTIEGNISAALPAPGAILLSGIGVCLVGWLRRRRTL